MLSIRWRLRAGQEAANTPRPRTIAVISNSAASLLTARRSLICRLTEAGLRVLAFAPDLDALTRSQLLALGAEPAEFFMSPHGTSPVTELRSVFSLARQLRRHRPDLCFACFVKPVLYTGVASWLARVPRRYGLIAGLGYAFAPETVLRPGWGGAVAAGLALRSFDGLLFQNEADRNDLVHRLKIPELRSYLTGGTGVNLAAFAPLARLPPKHSPEVGRALTSAGADEDCRGFSEPAAGWAAKPCRVRVTFLFAARFLQAKGLADFVAAAEAVHGTHPSARFIALGAPLEHPDAIAPDLLAGWKSRGIVEFPGHQPILPWLHQSDVAVLPSWYREGVPRFLQEAVAAGRAVITCNLPGCADAVIDGETGLLVPPRAPSGLARAMRTLLDQPELIRRYGAAGHDLARRRFDARQQDRRLLEIMGV